MLKQQVFQMLRLKYAVKHLNIEHKLSMKSILVFLTCNYCSSVSASVRKKYDGTSNMAEFRSRRPTPSKQFWNRGYIYTYIYICNSHCNIVILVGLHVLVVRAKYNINVINFRRLFFHNVCTV